MDTSISLRPQYSSKKDSICTKHVKRIHNKKFNISDSITEQKTKMTQYSDVLLDCEHSNNILGFLENDNYVPQEWECYKLDDVINVTVFHSKETNKITFSDVDDFFNLFETPLYYEEDSVITEDEQE